ncbi:MAG: SPFH domain-containing protein [Planctomycetota bacterium]
MLDSLAPVLLAARYNDSPDYLIVAVVGLALMSLGFMVLLVSRYKRVPADRILVVFGRTGADSRGIRCYVGGAAFVLPLVQDYTWLSRLPIRVQTDHDELSKDNARVRVAGVYHVAIGTEPELMTNAAERLLGVPEEQIGLQAGDIIRGQVRLVVASLPAAELQQDYERFLREVRSALEPELAKIGLVVVSLDVGRAQVGS